MPRAEGNGARLSGPLRQLVRLCEERGWDYTEVGRRMPNPATGKARSPEWWRGIALGKQKNVNLRDVETLATLLGVKVELKARADPVVTVEAALASDPELREHTREVILAAYRRGRINGSAATRPKGKAASSR